MIHVLENAIRRTRRFVSRSEWAARLMGFRISPETGTHRGLVMIQLDGLSAEQAERAINQGRMPFLKHLLRDEGYRFVRFYSGVPSTTPAVQGELFYGVRQAVPAFSFLNRETGRIVRMYEREPANEIEASLDGNEGLLKGGTAYADIYTGGAADPRFCAASGNVSDLVRARRPLEIPLMLVANAYSIVRLFVRFGLEVLLSIGGMLRGLAGGQNPTAELKMVPSRIFVCIFLRELMTIEAKVDIARGVPVVHLNFLAYDEQAHRRGPTSRFAHWSLRGMDDAVKRIVGAAHRSAGRAYDVWIYSDHGQEETESYIEVNGEPVQDAVARVFEELGIRSQRTTEPKRGVQSQRTQMFGEWISRKLIAGADVGGEWLEEGRLLVTAMGPLGHVYSPRALTVAERDAVAERIVREAHVPMVLTRDDAGGADAWTSSGRFHLPEDAARILGEDHPYREAAAEDLARLCRHRFAGDLILSGWRLDGVPLSFPLELGAHAGPGVHETSPFIVVPGDIRLPTDGAGPLRPLHIRQAALRFLGTEKFEPNWVREARDARENRVRIMTYNVHSCRGMDGKLSPTRIARVIDLYEPDIVALQELDVGRGRSNAEDQAEIIARELQMEFHFHPVIHVEEEKYGDAVLTHLPMKLARTGKFPSLNGSTRLEPRGAIRADIYVGGQLIHLFNTHLGLVPAEREIQTAALLGPEWLGAPELPGLRVLCGDFNAGPKSPTHRKLSAVLRDAQAGHEVYIPQSTFFGRMPVARIDHVFVERSVEVVEVQVPSTRLTRAASDHLPLIVDIILPAVSTRATELAGAEREILLAEQNQG